MTAEVSFSRQQKKLIWIAIEYNNQVSRYDDSSPAAEPTLSPDTMHVTLKLMLTIFHNN
jgi:hypothetical protein